MLTYYTDKPNIWTFRIRQATMENVELQITDMYSLLQATASLSGITYDDYESLISFTASISSANSGSEYRATLYASSSLVWNGTIQVHPDTDEPKWNVESQIDNVKSNVSENRYIIMD